MVKKSSTKKTTKVPTGSKGSKTPTTKTLTFGNVKNIWNKHWQLILVSGIVIGILSFIGINQLIIYNQKQQFKAAEESLDALYADIVKQTGEPTSVTKDKSCSYRSQKIGRGERSCRINITSIYNDVNDVNMARTKSSTIEKVIVNKSYIRLANSGTSHESNWVGPNDYYASDDLINSNTSIRCYAEYTLSSNNKYAGKFAFTLGCSDPSRSEFYPVND